MQLPRAGSHAHVAAQVQGEIGAWAKAMIITRSRLHAVRIKLTVDNYLAERGYPFKALVAFSGTVEDGGRSYTEPGMNGLPEAQTAKTFELPECYPREVVEMALAHEVENKVEAAISIRFDRERDSLRPLEMREWRMGCPPRREQNSGY